MGNFILNLGIFTTIFEDFQAKFWKNFLLNLGNFSWNFKKNSEISENFFSRLVSEEKFDTPVNHLMSIKNTI